MFLLQTGLETFEVTTFTGVAAASAVVVSALKWGFPRLVIDRERVVALVVALLLTVTSKLTHIGFQDTPWVTLIVMGLAAGPASGVIYQHGTQAFKPKDIKHAEAAANLQRVLNPEIAEKVIKPEIAAVVKARTGSVPVQKQDQTGT